MWTCHQQPWWKPTGCVSRNIVSSLLFALARILSVFTVFPVHSLSSSCRLYSFDISKSYSFCLKPYSCLFSRKNLDNTAILQTDEEAAALLISWRSVKEKIQNWAKWAKWGLRQQGAYSSLLNWWNKRQRWYVVDLSLGWASMNSSAAEDNNRQGVNSSFCWEVFLKGGTMNVSLIFTNWNETDCCCLFKHTQEIISRHWSARSGLNDGAFLSKPPTCIDIRTIFFTIFNCFLV